MKTNVFYSSIILKRLIIFPLWLAFFINLTNCQNQEKKTEPQIKTETKDTLNQQLTNETKIDTTKGIFLIYKFGDSANVVNDKTWYMVKNGTLNKEAIKDELSKTFENIFYYKILIDPKYAISISGHYIGDDFIADDSYLSMNLSFNFFEDKLYQIKLFTGLRIEDTLGMDDGMLSYMRSNTEKDIKAILDVYSKKYSGWNRRENEFGLAEYSHRKGDTKITIQDNYYGVSVLYTDLIVEGKQKKQVKNTLKKKMDEKNKGI